MIKTLSKIIRGQKLVFANLKAIFWESEKILIISDLHIGKAAHFRKSGIAVPSLVLADDLDNLAALISYFNPREILVVGDLLHAGYNSDLEIYASWRAQYPHVKVTLIEGNHDRISSEILNRMGIDKSCTQLSLGPFTFIHEPTEKEESQFIISGHLHPGIVLRQGKIQNLRLACFAYSERQLVLPAFSKFTGLDYKSLNGNCIRIAVHPDFIFEV